MTTYTTTLPAFDAPIWSEEFREILNPDVLKWSGEEPPPALGDVVGGGRMGPLYVTGYFEEHGWLGVTGLPLAPPPSWLDRPGDPRVHVFGAEITPVNRDPAAEAGCTPEELAAVQTYAREHGKAWKDDLLDDWMYARLCGTIHRLRNTNGPSWLDALTLPTKKEA